MHEQISQPHFKIPHNKLICYFSKNIKSFMNQVIDNRKKKSNKEKPKSKYRTFKYKLK